MKRFPTISNRRKKGRVIVPVVLVLLLGAYAVYRYHFADSGAGPAPPPKPSLDDRTIARPRIDVILPLSGDFEHEGKMMKNGAELAWKELQKLGIRASISYIDGAADRAEVSARVKESVSNPDTLLLVAHLPATILDEVLAHCDAERLPAVVPAAGHQKYAHRERVLPFVSGDRSRGAYAAELAAKWSEERAPAVVYEKNAYGELLLAGFGDGAQKARLPFEAVTCEPGDVFLQKAADETVKGNYSVVFLAGSPAWAVRLVDALGVKGFKGKLILPESFDGMFLEDLPPERASGELFVLGPFAPDFETASPAVKEFRKAFIGTFWSEPDFHAALGYDTIKWIGKTVEEGPNTRGGIRERLVRNASRENPFEGIAGKVFFEEGDVRRPFGVMVYKDGKLVPVHDG